MKDRQDWQGSPSELLTALEDEAKDLRIDIEAKAWPKSPSWAVRRCLLLSHNNAQEELDCLA